MVRDFVEAITKRQLASIVGGIIWSLRVRGCDLLDKEELMNIASRLGQAEDDDWDDDFKVTDAEKNY